MSFLDSLAGGLLSGSGVSGGKEGGVVAAVLQMLQSYPGGVTGVIQAFERAGLGGVAQSWVAKGSNQPVAAAQVQQALGQAPVNQVAARLGTSPEEASGQIARLLPLLVDHVTPQGTAPSDGGLGALGGLLSQLKV